MKNREYWSIHKIYKNQIWSVTNRIFIKLHNVINASSLNAIIN